MVATNATPKAPLPGQVTEQAPPVPAGSSQVAAQVTRPCLRTPSKDGIRSSVAQATPIVPSCVPGPPGQCTPQEVLPLNEFVVHLEMMIKDQHQELLRRLSDFVRCQEKRPVGADVSDPVPSGPCGSVLCKSDSGRSVLGIQRLKQKPTRHTLEQKSTHHSLEQQSTGQSMEMCPRAFAKAVTSVMDEALGTGVVQTSSSHRASLELAWSEKWGTDTHAKLLRITVHWSYQLALACFLLANALCTAWETDYYARQARAGESPQAVQFDYLMVFFCCIFTADLILRIWAQQARFFYCLDWKWHWFDIVVVLSFVAETVDAILQSRIYWLPSTSALRIVRLVRLVRVARIGRALRSFARFRVFRITISMLVDSVELTVILSIVVALIGMVFAVFFTDGSTTRIISHGVDDDLVKYFGSFFVTMSTLQMAIFGGIDWEVAIEPLGNISGVYVLMFHVYVAFCSLAMLNVFNAVFVENMFHRAKNDRDFVVQTEIEGHREFLSTMDLLFAELDEDGSGTILLHELEAHIMNPEVNAYFRTIDVNVFKVKEFFRLMDMDKSGGIDRSEFVRGCTRLRGEAKELDVAILQYEVKSLFGEIQKIHELLSQFGEKLDGPLLA